MFRKAGIFAFTLVFISTLLIVNAQTLVGGYSELSPNEFKNVQNLLENSNLRTAIGATNSCVKVVQVVSASRQVVAGLIYKIVAIIEINGVQKTYCFKVYQSLPPVTVTVQCAAVQCGCSICECLKN